MGAVQNNNGDGLEQGSFLVDLVSVLSSHGVGLKPIGVHFSLQCASSSPPSLWYKFPSSIVALLQSVYTSARTLCMAHHSSQLLFETGDLTLEDITHVFELALSYSPVLHHAGTEINAARFACCFDWRSKFQHQVLLPDSFDNILLLRVYRRHEERTGTRILLVSEVRRDIPITEVGRLGSIGYKPRAAAGKTFTGDLTLSEKMVVAAGALKIPWFRHLVGVVQRILQPLHLPRHISFCFQQCLIRGERTVNGKIRMHANCEGTDRPNSVTASALTSRRNR